MSLDNLLNQLGTLQSTAYESDASAGLTREWTTLAEDVPIRIEDSSAREINDYGARGVEITHRVFTKNSQGKNGYRWLMSDGRYYIIRTLPQRRQIGNMPTFFALMCQEVAPDG